MGRKSLEKPTCARFVYEWLTWATASNVRSRRWKRLLESIYQRLRRNSDERTKYFGNVEDLFHLRADIERSVLSPRSLRPTRGEYIQAISRLDNAITSGPAGRQLGPEGRYDISDPAADNRHCASQRCIL